MKLALPVGTTSQIVHVFIRDSTVATGAGKTALAFGDITAYYVRAGGTLTALTTETIATLGTWASTGNNYLGFKLLNDTNAPGLYEIDLPNNILATGANQVVIQLRATGAVPCLLEIQLAAIPADVTHVHGTALTEAGGAGRLAASISKFGDVATPVLTAESVNQTGDAYSPADAAATDAAAAHAAIDTLVTTVGGAGAGLTALATQASVNTIDGIVDSILADTGTDGVVVVAGSKTGYKLASDGLDSVATTAPSGVASNFREMLVAVWRHCFKKRTFNNSTGDLKTYADNGTSVLTTQNCTDDGTTETQGAAS